MANQTATYVINTSNRTEAALTMLLGEFRLQQSKRITYDQVVWEVLKATHPDIVERVEHLAINAPDSETLSMLRYQKRLDLNIRSVVYFVQCRNLIKIGSTANLEERLTNHRYEFARHELHLLGVIQGGLNTERDIQRQFQHLRRYRREWFKAAPELIEWILANAQLV